MIYHLIQRNEIIRFNEKYRKKNGIIYIKIDL
jgi:hypothetical protein